MERSLFWFFGALFDNKTKFLTTTFELLFKLLIWLYLLLSVLIPSEWFLFRTLIFDLELFSNDGNNNLDDILFLWEEFEIVFKLK